MYVVEHDGHAVAGRFGQADIARNDGFKDLRAEKAAKVGGNLLGECGAVVVHREENAFDREGRIDRAAEAHEGVKKFCYTFERQELALNGYEDGVGCSQCIDGEKVERRRAVDEDIIVFGEDAGDGALEAVLAVLDIH